MGDSFFLQKAIAIRRSWCSGYVFIMKIDYWVWRTYSKVILLVCFILLILVLIPGVGLVRGGARLDWNRGIFHSTVRIYEVCDDYFLSEIFSGTTKLITSFKRGLLPALGFVFLAFGMIMLQPDLGTGTVMVGTCIIMIFISGARVFHFAMFGLLCSRICRANCISTVSDETYYIIFRPVVRSAWKWISNYSIVTRN